MVVFLIIVIKARNELSTVSMSKREQPDHLFSKLLAIKVKLGGIASLGINDEVLIA